MISALGIFCAGGEPPIVGENLGLGDQACQLASGSDQGPEVAWHRTILADPSDANRALKPCP
jgi:hypothetical protein